MRAIPFEVGRPHDRLRATTKLNGITNRFAVPQISYRNAELSTYVCFYGEPADVDERERVYCRALLRTF